MKENDDDRVKELRKRNMWSFWLFVLLVAACLVVNYFQSQNSGKEPTPTEIKASAADSSK